MATSKIKESLFNDPSNFDMGITANANLGAGSENNVTINFHKTMSSDSKVFVQIYGPMGYAGYLIGHVKAVYSNKMTYCIKNSSNTALSYQLHWMVIK